MPSTKQESNTPSKLNILVAYPYMKKATIEELIIHQGKINFLLDSGAFTAWRSGNPIKLDDYCKFLDQLPIKPWKYFALDVIGDHKETMENYKEMLKRGYNPIPVFTPSQNFDDIDEYYTTSDIIGCGGLVDKYRTRGIVHLNNVMKKVRGRPIHLLGFTSLKYLKHFRPYSCDSSSWASALRYASLNLYDKNGKFINCSKQDFIKQPSPDILRLLREYKVDYNELAKVENWKNSGRGDYAIEQATIRSWVKLHNDIEKNIKTKLFLATASPWQIRIAVEAWGFWNEYHSS